DGIRDFHVTGVQTCALPIWLSMPDLGASLAFSLIFATGITSGAAVTAIVTAGTLLGYAAPLALAIGAQAYQLSKIKKNLAPTNRSEERRVGKESRPRGDRDH